MKASNSTPKQSHPSSSLSSPKYSPNGNGASKSEGPITAQDKKLCCK